MTDLIPLGTAKRGDVLFLQAMRDFVPEEWKAIRAFTHNIRRSDGIIIHILGKDMVPAAIHRKRKRRVRYNG